MVAFVIDEVLSDFCYSPYSGSFPERADEIIPLMEYAAEQGIVCHVRVMTESIGVKRCGMRRTEFVAREEYLHRLVIDIENDTHAVIFRMRFPRLPIV